MQFTRLFDKTLKEFAESKLLISYGGSGSSKTVSAMQLLFIASQLKNNLLIAFMGQTIKKVKNTLIEDFQRYVMPPKMFNKFFNKSDLYLSFPNNSKILFLSADDPSKYVGTRFDHVLFDEVNTFKNGHETFKQVFGRLRGRAICCFNPAARFWLSDYEADETTRILHSTYKDNQYLPQETLNNLLYLSERDENFKRVYLNGEYGFLEGLIYTYKKHWDTEYKEPKEWDLSFTALDFGYVHPLAVVKAKVVGMDIYAKTIAYESGLLLSDVYQILSNAGIQEVVADSEDSRAIAEFRRKYPDIVLRAVKKGQDSVKTGINKVKEYTIHVAKNDPLVKELQNYRWKKDKDGNTIEQPVKELDDGLDALRYGVMTYL